MSAGEYISMRVQREVFERLIHLEAHEIGSDPEAERAELASLYERKGISPDLAGRLADELMRDPKVALDTHARVELGIDPDEGLGSPWGAAISSFVMFAVGALFPLIPFFFRGGTAAVLIAGAITISVFWKSRMVRARSSSSGVLTDPSTSTTSYGPRSSSRLASHLQVTFSHANRFPAENHPLLG